MTAPSVIPTLTFTDPRAAVGFLVDVLGFREVEITKGDDGSIVHGELSWDDGIVMIGPKRAGSPFSVGPACTYFTLDDPDGHFAKVTAAGDVDVVMGLTDQPYGSREFAVRDAEGNLWCFGTYRPEARSTKPL